METNAIQNVKHLMAEAIEKTKNRNSATEIAKCLGVTDSCISKRPCDPDKFSMTEGYLLKQMDPSFKADMEAIDALGQKREAREMQGLLFSGMRNFAAVQKELIDILEDGVVTSEEEAHACQLFANLKAYLDDGLMEMKEKLMRERLEKGITK